MSYKDLFSSLIDPITGKIPEFDYGYLAGIGVMVLVLTALLLIRIIIWLMLMPRRCKGIEIKEENGNVLIAAEAVSDLILSLQPEFADIAINKIRLYKKGKRQRAVLTVAFDTRNGSMTEQRILLKARIIDILENILGITSVTDICIHCTGIKVSGSLPRSMNRVDDHDFVQDTPGQFHIPLEADK